MLGLQATVIGHWANVPPEIGPTRTEAANSKAEYQRFAYRQLARLPWLQYSSNSSLNGAAYATLMEIPIERVTTVHNGIDEQALLCDAQATKELRIELGIPDSASVVGSVMRLVDQKRPLLWVDVAAQIAALRPDTHFVLLGSGGMSQAVSEHVAAQALDNFHLCGNRSDVGTFLSLFDVFLLTSRIEGVPNAAVEAQLSACPVVAQDVGGVSEILSHRHTGLLLDDANPTVIAAAVLELLDSSAMADELVSNAKQEAQIRHSLVTLVDKHRKMFMIRPDMEHAA